MQEEIKVYTVDVAFKDAGGDRVKKNFMCFAKNLSEIEELAKKELLESFICINAVQHLEDFAALTN